MQTPIQLEFDMHFSPAYGSAVPVARDVARVTVNNPSPFTFHGTNSYIVGEDTLAVIDPGPEDEAHLHALLEVINGRPVSHILVTHTHRDHSPLAIRLKLETGAKIVAEGMHRPARPPRHGESERLDASGDMNFVPDMTLGEGDVIEGDGWSFTTVLTPGHAANHAAFALNGTDILFSGDHVMAWSTTIVAPPDGSMSDYLASLEKLIVREDGLLLPGHGGPVVQPRSFMRGLLGHRKMREHAILKRLEDGDRKIHDIVKVIYRTTDPRLHGAAGLSVLAHLEDLVTRGAVVSEGDPSIDAVFRPAR